MPKKSVPENLKIVAAIYLKLLAMHTLIADITHNIIMYNGPDGICMLYLFYQQVIHRWEAK